MYATGRNYASLLMLILLISCDIIEAPFTEKTDNGQQTTDTPQKVLLFDFTGHTCKSCPKAHKTIDQLNGLYGDRLVPIAFHLGYFAKPMTNGKFTTDFRTPEGTLLEQYFDFVSFPIGTVQTLNQDQLQPYASWPALVSANITGDSPVKIEINPEYLPGLNAITPEIYITALETVAGPLNLAVYLVEDSIVDWQKDEDFDPMDISDYVHNHLFRTSLNGLWGQPLGTAEGMAKGFTFQSEFSKILNIGWKAGNCTIIAFVFREDTKEVLQVEAKEL
ncbi:MAG: Omp28-related outer membrane protein [Bacteroidia bacterium]|nr:Omp28-related outer membrane protein [Bacteroidia bacterium]